MAAVPALPKDDDAAFFAAFHAELQNTVRKVVRTSAANIEDACADAWLALLRYRPTEKRSLRGWLVVVAIREAIQRDQRDRRHRTLVERGDWRDTRSETATEVIPQLHVDDELLHDARVALELVASLEQRDREVFVLHVAGFSYDEIAELTGSTRTAVDRYLRQARAQVRGCSAQPKRGRRAGVPS